MLQPVERKVFNEILDDLPADKYEVLRAFMTYIRDSDSGDCANLLSFFNESKAAKRRYTEAQERITTDSGSKRTVGMMGYICESINAYEANDWLYAYIMRIGMWPYFSIFYKELGKRLVVANEENWRQRIFRIKKECDEEGGRVEFRKKVLDSLRRELQDSNNGHEPAFEAAADMATQHLLEGCRDFLIEYFLNGTLRTQDIVDSLKAKSKDSAEK